MRESKYTSYDALPVMLTAPEVGEVLGISKHSPIPAVSATVGKPSERTILAKKFRVPGDFSSTNWLQDKGVCRDFPGTAILHRPATTCGAFRSFSRCYLLRTKRAKGIKKLEPLGVSTHLQGLIPKKE